MQLTNSGDPRLQELFGPDAAAAAGIRPVVRLPRSALPGWAIAASAILAAMLLFWILDSRRGVQSAPEVRPRTDVELFSPAPPPLYIPPAPVPLQLQQASLPAPQAAFPAPAPRAATIAAPPPPQIVYQQPTPQQQLLPPVEPPRNSPGSALVIDTTAPAASAPAAPGAAGAVATGQPPRGGGRARASTFANPSNTVAQGALIPAVLETAFNSTSAGLARAIVSRDVRGFDGTKILVPRGSRLIGEYQADAALGQKRALITWTRLIRPDGVTIDLDSPATDNLGRGGVAASVNTHFWERFGNALLRSAVDIGTGFANRAARGPVVVAVPGSAQAIANPSETERYVPTLSVPAATSISVFVARDLEFPESRRSR
jgi:type IV secretion system protein VirB10